MKKHKCDCDQSYCPLEWEGQEIPFDHPDSNCFFNATHKPVVATRASVEVFGTEIMMHVFVLLYREAVKHNGLDYLQVFRDREDITRVLWAIEDGQAITLLLPEDY